MKILIVLEGGLVSAVCTDGAPSPDGVLEDLIVIDYDTDGADASETTEIEQSDGEMVPALMHRPMPERCKLNWAQFDEDDDENGTAKSR